MAKYADWQYDKARKVLEEKRRKRNQELWEDGDPYICGPIRDWQVEDYVRNHYEPVEDDDESESCRRKARKSLVRSLGALRIIRKLTR